MSPTPSESPAADARSDEQIKFDCVDQIIEIMLPLDPHARRVVYATVGAFFGFDEPATP